MQITELPQLLHVEYAVDYTPLLTKADLWPNNGTQDLEPITSVRIATTVPTLGLPAAASVAEIWVNQHHQPAPKVDGRFLVSDHVALVVARHDHVYGTTTLVDRFTPITLVTADRHETWHLNQVVDGQLQSLLIELSFHENDDEQKGRLHRAEVTSSTQTWVREFFYPKGGGSCLSPTWPRLVTQITEGACKRRGTQRPGLSVELTDTKN